MKVLFIGGTGRLSKDVVTLTAENNEVWLLTRGSSERKRFVKDNYHMIYADVRNIEDAQNKLNGLYFDVVVDFLSYKPEDLMKTLEVIKGKCRQYIFISSATVYSKSSEDEIITEKATKRGNEAWVYAFYKYKIEEYLKENYGRYELEYYTIIRPYVTYGETRVPYPLVPRDNSKEYSLVVRMKNGMPVPTFDEGRTQTTITHTRDFAKAVCGLMGNEKAVNEDFHITGDVISTWGEVLECIDKKLGTVSRKIDFSQEQISKAMPEYKSVLEGDKGHSMRFDNSKIKNAVCGLSFDVALKDGVAEMIDFYEKNTEYILIDYRWMGKVDRLCGCKETPQKLKMSMGDKIRYLMGYYKIIGKAGDLALRVAVGIKNAL